MLNFGSMKNSVSSLSNPSNLIKSPIRKRNRANSILPQISNNFKFSISSKKSKHQIIIDSLPFKYIRPTQHQSYLALKPNKKINIPFSPLRFRTILPRNFKKKQIKKIKIPSMFSLQKKVFVKFKETYANVYYNKNANLTYFDLYQANNIVYKKKCRINLFYCEFKHNNIFEDYLFDFFLIRQSYVLRRFLLFFIYNSNTYSYSDEIELEFLKNKRYPGMIENFINLIIIKKSTIFSYSILNQIITNIKHTERKLRLNTNDNQNIMETYFRVLAKIIVKQINNSFPKLLMLILNDFLILTINNYISKKQKETRKSVISIFKDIKRKKSIRSSKTLNISEDNILLNHCYSLDSIDENYNINVKKNKLENNNPIILKSKNKIERNENRRDTNDSEVKDMENLIKKISISSDNIINNDKKNNNVNDKKIIEPKLYKFKFNINMRQKTRVKSVIFNRFQGVDNKKAKIYNYFLNKNNESSFLGTTYNQTLIANHNKCSFEFKKAKDFVIDKRNNDKKILKINKNILKILADIKNIDKLNINMPYKMAIKNKSNFSDYIQHSMFDNKKELKNNLSRAEYHDLEFKSSCASYLIMRKANKQNIKIRNKDRKYILNGNNFKQISKSADIYL